MAYLATNSTNTPLGANESYIGESYQVDKEYISVSCSFNTNVAGSGTVLEFFHSIDGFSFSNYNDIFNFSNNAGSHSIEVSVKGKFFKIRYVNGSVAQTTFNLFCKLNKEVAESILNATYDSVKVFNGESGGLNIRHLTSSTDSVAIPQLNPVIYNDAGITTILTTIHSMPAIVIPPITIGDVNIKDSNGNDILSNNSGYLQTEIMNSSLSVSGSVSVSNQISGYATSANQITAQASLTSLVNGVRVQASNGNVINSTNGHLETNLYALNNGVYSPLTSKTPASQTHNALHTYNLSNIKGQISGGLETDINAVSNSGFVSLSTIDYNSNSILAGITGIRQDIQGLTSIYIENDILDVNVDNIIRTSQILNNNNYDLDLTGSTLWADSSPVFVENPQGDNGWYYQSVNSASASNVYYYGNNPLFVQSNIIYNTIESIFSVIDLDYIGTEPQRNLPFLVLRTQPTGSGDYQPGFAHSVQTYIIPSSETLMLNEKILIWADINNTNYNLPSDLYPGIRRVKLELFSTNGLDFSNLPIGYISINTATNSQSVRYTLHHAGFSFLKNSIDNISSWNFINSRKRLAETNLSNLSVVNGYLGITGHIDTGLTSIFINNISPIGITGSVNILSMPHLSSSLDSVGITGSVIVSSMPHLNSSLDSVGITGSVNILSMPHLSSSLDSVGITGSVIVSSMPHLSSSTDSVGITGSVIVSSMPHLNSSTDSVGITGHVIVDNIGDINISSDSLMQVYTDTGATAILNGYTDANNANRNYLYTNDKLLNDKIQNTLITGETGINCFINNTMTNPANVAIHATKGGAIKDLNASSHGALYTELYDNNKKLSIDSYGALFGTIKDKDGHHLSSNNFNGALYSQFTTDTLINEAWNTADTSINVSIVNGLVNIADSGGNAFSSTKVGSDYYLNTQVKGGTVNSSLYSGSQALTNTANGAKYGLDVNIINSGNIGTQDSNINSAYDSTNTAIKVNVVASTGALNIKDSVGNNILVDGVSTNNLKVVDKNVSLSYNSTALSINSHPKLYTGSAYVSQSCDSSGYANMNIMNTPNVQIKDSSGSNITSIVGSGAVAGAVKTVLIGQTNNANIGDTQTSYGGTSKLGINAVLVNGASTPAVVGGVSGTTPTALKVDSTGILDTSGTIKNSSGNVISADLLSTLITTSGKYGLNTNSLTCALDTTAGGLLPITTSTINTRQNLHVYDNEVLGAVGGVNSSIATTNSTLSTINNKLSTTNNNITTGLNVYPINPIKLSYTMGGFNGNTTGNPNQCLGFQGTFDSQALTTQFGLSNPKYYWVYFSTALESGILDFDYVNGNGAIATGASRTVSSANTWTSLFVSNVAIGGLLKFQKRGGSGASNQVEIAWTNTNVAPTSRATNIGTHGNNSYFLGLMTIPLGYTGIIKSISTYANVATLINIVKYERNNSNRLTVWGTTNSATVQLVYTPNIEIEEGCSFLVSKQGLSADVYYYAQIDLIKNI